MNWELLIMLLALWGAIASSLSELESNIDKKFRELDLKIDRLHRG